MSTPLTTSARRGESAGTATDARGSSAGAGGPAVHTLDELLRGEPAEHLLRLVLADLPRRARNGLSRPSWTDEMCRALYAAAGTPEPLSAVGSDIGTDPSTVDLARPVPGVPVREAARMTGLSESYIKRLCRRRQVVASRPGREWLVDIDSLCSVTGRTARDRDR